MKYAVIFLFLISCNEAEDNPPSMRQYTLSKSDDNNWSTSGRIQCDSFTYVTPYYVKFYVDGRSADLKGKLIKAFTNDNYKK